MGDRPLFRDEASFRKLYEERLPYYRQADYRVESGGEPMRVVEQILALGIFGRSRPSPRRRKSSRSAIVMKRDKYFAKRLLGPALALALAAAVLAARPSRAGFSPRAPIPADASVFSADKGKLRILINGQPVGSEDFEISQSGGGWIERSSTSAHAPGGADIKATGQLSSRSGRHTHPLRLVRGGSEKSHRVGRFCERDGKMLGRFRDALAIAQGFRVHFAAHRGARQ